MAILDPLPTFLDRFHHKEAVYIICIQQNDALYVNEWSL